MVRRYPGEYPQILQSPAQLLFRHAVQIPAGHALRHGVGNRKLFRDRESRILMISRNHDRSHAGLTKQLHRAGRLRTRRIHHRRKAKKHQILLLPAVSRLFCRPQHAVGLFGKRRCAQEELLPLSFRKRTFPCFRKPEPASGQKKIRRSLHVSNNVLAPSMYRSHPLARRIKGTLPDPRPLPPQQRNVHSLF